jgi:photosystem II stability/assembly factor-like uncharacterized protein
MEAPSAPQAGVGRAGGSELGLNRILVAFLLALLACVIAFSQPPHPRPEAERSLAEQFLYPIETNPGLRLPALPASLNSISFAGDGVHGWAAGGGGALLRTEDGGKSWAAVATGTAATFHALHVTSDGRKGWAVGERGAILSTVDGGGTWRLQRAPVDSRLTGVTFNGDGTVGWLWGNDGALLRSGDGGQTWRLQASSRPGASTSVAINWMNGRGVALTRDTPVKQALARLLGLQHFTTGGIGAGSLGSPGTGSSQGAAGGTGSLQGAAGGSPGTGPIRGTEAVPEGGGSEAGTGGGTSFGAAGGAGTPIGGSSGSQDGGLVAGNTDAAGLGKGNVTGGRVNPTVTNPGGVDPGATNPANPAGAPPEAPPQLRELYFDAGGRRFWAFGSKGSLSVSESGTRWRTRILDRRVDIADLHFAADGRAGWAVGSGGAIFSTADGGETWARRQSGTSSDLESVSATPDGRKVWAAGADGTLVASDDGGDSWRALSSGVATVLENVEISSDGKQAWAVGGRGLILSSGDGGSTWQQRDSGTGRRLSAVAFDFSGQYGLAVGDAGTIVASADGGASWQNEQGGAGSDLTDVWLSPIGNRAWIARREGGLLYRIDRTGNWTQRPATGLGPISSVRGGSGPIGDLAVGPSAAAATRDGGGRWRLVPQSVAPAGFKTGDIADNDAAAMVGAGGRVLVARAGGANVWRPGSTSTDATLNSIHMVGAGPLAWAAGEGGTILASRDQGLTWSSRDSGTGSARLGISFSSDGAIGLAVGHAPSLLRTVDGGATWTPTPLPLSYRRYPAPWFWAALLLACAPLVFPLRRAGQGEDDEEGAAAIGASDKPTQDFAHDRLQFGPLALGISRFLRNSRTEPPLTLAISGNWGSGKSSLMQLVCTDLRRHGYRPVWFNAWHHQSDEQLLASLLNSVREQGLPSLASIDGWIFRFRLLWLRSKKNYAFALVAVAVVAAALVTWLSGDIHSASWARIATSIGDLLGKDSAARGAEAKDAVAPFSVLGGLTVLFAAYRATRAFGLDPAVLLSSSFNSFRLKDASAQTSFRDRFAQEFEDVTEALPYRMVIVVDDLDRCRPETVLTVMESVNFLVSAGPCFILFGMARERVLAGLSLTFHSIAKELTELDVALPADATEVERERAEREARGRYANDYLEKLINIDIKVPAREDIPPHVLLEAEPDPSPQGPYRILRQAWPALLVLAAAGLGMAAPSWLGGSDPAAPQAVTDQAPPAAAAAQPPAGSRPAAVESSAAAPAPAAAPADRIQAPLRTAQVQPGEERAAWWLLLAGLGGFALVLAALLRHRSRREQREVKDSRAFLQALQTWLPVVQQKRPSPRRIKRFGNFIRYLAMLQQGDPPPEAPATPLWPRFPFRPRHPAEVGQTAAPPATKPVVEEHRLVALAALYDAYEGRWRENLWPQGSEPLDAAVRDAIGAAERESSWPPSAEELASFEEAIKGIRLAGAAEVVRAGRRDAHPRGEAVPPLSSLERERERASPAGGPAFEAAAPTTASDQPIRRPTAKRTRRRETREDGSLPE